MNARLIASLFLIVTYSTSVAAQQSETYQIPRTEYGDPDLQGVWGMRFNTLLERPEGVPLVLPPEAVAGFGQTVYERGGLAGNTDPDIDMFGPPVLTQVNGEYRSSVIVYHENGVLPYNDLGNRTAAYGYFEGVGYDHPEQRPGVERCIEAWASPPMRAFAYQLYNGIV
jgi:hypothetical protein